MFVRRMDFQKCFIFHLFVDFIVFLSQDSALSLPEQLIKTLVWPSVTDGPRVTANNAWLIPYV